MKAFKKIVVFALITSFFASCNQKTAQITHQEDYNKYLQIKEDKSVDFANNEIDFWQAKYNNAPNQIAYLSQIASNYSTLFEQTGNINFLYKTEELLLKSNEAYKYSSVGTIRSLGRNYISQHRFKEALVLANKALAIGEGLKETHKLLFDVQMELGNYEAAKKSLDFLKDINDFDYLIRIAKWNDHRGDLETAISLMERAKTKAEEYENKTLKVWIYLITLIR
jgi:tetratricopeptide (TPR) repeat protein